MASNTTRELLIITHDNAFHLDDVIACFILKKIYPDSRIIRTRDRDIIETGDIVVDVGGVFDPLRMRYDHHQKGFEETYDSNYSIKLSSAGLVYKYHKMEFIKALNLSFADPSYSMLFSSILYDIYFVSVDANDNGIDIADSVRYNERSLDSMTKCFLPYNLSPNGTYAQHESIRYAAFCEAMEYMGADLVRQCTSLASTINSHAEEIRSAFESIKDKETLYLIMEKGFWTKELIYYYNKLYNKQIYVIITRKKGPSGYVYSITALPAPGIKYAPKIPLCKEWRGIRDKDLATISGLKDANFVHATGFCGSANTLQTAITMVEMSIEEYFKESM